MTAPVAAQPLSVFTSAIAQINGATAPDTVSQAEASPFRQLISHLIGLRHGEAGNLGSAPTLQDVLAEEEPHDITAELAAIMPFLSSLGFTPQESVTQGAQRLATANSLGDPTSPRTLAASNVLKGISAAAANTAAASAFAGTDTTESDPQPSANLIATLLSRQAREHPLEAIGRSDSPVNSPEPASPSFASLSSALQSVATPGQTSVAAASHALPAAVGSSDWGNEFANRVVWMTHRNESRADLILNPPQMGRVEVSLSITGDQATANFASHNPAVREALESALPRLREVLAEAGIQLGNAHVGAENPRQFAQQENNGENPALGRTSMAFDGRNMQTEEARTDSMSHLSGMITGRGLVDVFA